MARERRGAGSSVVSTETLYYKTIYKKCIIGRREISYQDDTLHILQVQDTSLHRILLLVFHTRNRLHTDVFAHRSFYTQMFLHTETFTHRRFYTQTLLHTEVFTHRRFTHRHFYTRKFLRTNTFTHRRFYTQTPLHTDVFTRKHFYTQTFLHTDVFTRRHFYTQTFLHRFFLHTEVFTRTLYTHKSEERRRACYSLVSHTVGESFIEVDADDQQKEIELLCEILSRSRQR